MAVDSLWMECGRLMNLFANSPPVSRHAFPSELEETRRWHLSARQESIMMESEAISNCVHQFVCSAKAKVLMLKSVQHEHTALSSSLRLKPPLILKLFRPLWSLAQQHPLVFASQLGLYWQFKLCKHPVLSLTLYRRGLRRTVCQTTVPLTWGFMGNCCFLGKAPGLLLSRFCAAARFSSLTSLGLSRCGCGHTLGSHQPMTSVIRPSLGSPSLVLNDLDLFLCSFLKRWTFTV